MIFILGSLFYYSVPLLLGIFISHSHGAEKFGQYAFYLALIAPPMLLFGGGLRVVASSDSRKNYSDKDYLLIRVLFNFLLGFLAFCFWMITAAEMLFICIVLVKFGESAIDSVSGLQQRAGNRAKAGHNMIQYFVFSICTMFLLRNSSEAEITFLVLFLASSFIVAKSLYLLKSSVFSEKIVSDELILLTKKTLLIGFSLGVVSLVLGVPRFYLAQKSGLVSLAEFSALLSIVMIFGVCSSIAGQFIINSEGGVQSFVKKIRYISVGFSSVAIFLLILGPEPVELLYGESFKIDAKLYMIMLLFASVFSYQNMINYPLVKSKKENTILFVSIVQLGIMMLFVIVHSYVFVRIEAPVFLAIGLVVSSIAAVFLAQRRLYA